MALKAGDYWIGANGNTYVFTNRGNGNQVYDLGKQSNVERSVASNIVGGDITGMQRQIADPNPPKTAAAQEEAPVTSGSGAKAPVLNTAAIDNTNKAISSLDTERAVGNKNIDDSYGSVVGRYDQEAQRAKGDYDEGVVTTNTNLQKDKQNAYVAAAQGRRGLRGSLAAIGALSGDGARLADRAVTQGANEDIGGAAETATTNIGSLDKAKRNFDDEDKQRRADAETARNNSKTALEGTILSKQQQYYQKLAELFAEGGKTGEASTWLNKAGDLNSGIAQRTAVQASPIVAKSANFTPGDLESYLAGAGDMTVQVDAGANGAQTPATILAQKKRREEELATV